MKYLFLLVLLTRCTYKPGTTRLIQCGRITGCESIAHFDSKESCDGMMKQMQDKDSTWSYVCEVIK